jgi:UDP-N-acetylmuramate-alanine ligase
MHYHLIGIGGTAMASLAGMLQARGPPRDGVGPERLPADVDSA